MSNVLGAWLESDHNDNLFYMEEDDAVEPALGTADGKYVFSIELASGKISSPDAKLAEWVASMVKHAGKPIPDVMNEAASLYRDMDLGDDAPLSDDGGCGGSDYDDYGYDDADADFGPSGGNTLEQSRKEEAWREYTHRFENQTSATKCPAASAAAQRILVDIRNLWENGEKVHLKIEPIAGNIFNWETTMLAQVQMKGFDTDSQLHKDLVKYQQKTGKDHAVFRVHFPNNYPMNPPFIRAVSPRYAFHTGHITIGGSVCMEMLTMNGTAACLGPCLQGLPAGFHEFGGRGPTAAMWPPFAVVLNCWPTYCPAGWKCVMDIETVLVSLRCEMAVGGATLDWKQMNAQYSEQEGWDAYTRVAGQHGWQATDRTLYRN
eukprot:gene8744-219_t